jgi:sugar phosphate permease
MPKHSTGAIATPAAPGELPDKPPGRVRYEIWLVTFLIFFVAYLDRANVSVLIADRNYTQALGIFANKGSQGLLMTVFLFFYGLTSFFAGPVVDRLGPRKTLQCNLLLWAALLLAMAASSSFYVHLGCRSLLGLTGAMVAPVCSKLIHAWFPARERSKANGAWFIGLQFSLFAGIPLVAWLVSAYGWSKSFIALAIINLVPVLVCFRLVYDTAAKHPRITKEEVDYLSAGRTEDGSGKPHRQGSAATSYGFLSKKVFWFATIVYSMNLAGFWGIVSWLPSYLRTTHGMSWALTGGLAAAPYLVNMACLAVFTPLMDKYNSRAAFTMPSCALLILPMLLLTRTKDPIVAVVLIAMYMGCVTVANCSLFPILQNATDANEVAAAVGFFTGIAYVFSSAFPYAMGAIARYTGTLTTSFYLFVAVGVFSFLATLPMYRSRV